VPGVDPRPIRQPPENALFQAAHQAVESFWSCCPPRTAGEQAVAREQVRLRRARVDQRDDAGRVADEVDDRQRHVAEPDSVPIVDELIGRHRDPRRVQRMRDGYRAGRGAHLLQRLPVVGMLVRGDDPLDRRIAEIEAAMVERERVARETGFREGEAAGKAQAEVEVRLAIDRLAQSIAELDQYRTVLQRQAEADAVRLSLAIARRVLRRELSVDPAAIEGLLRAALQKLQSQERCRVRMHPSHAPVLRSEADRLGMAAKVEVVEDPAQEPGAAVFEMSRGNLDASIDTQLREIERGLVDRLQRA